MRPCFGPDGKCIFHRWIEKDGELYALVENMRGECKLLRHNSIRLLNFSRAYDECAYFGHQRTDEEEFNRLRELLILSGAITCTSESDSSELSEENKRLYMLPAEHYVAVDYTKLTNAVYNAGYRRVTEDKSSD